MTGSAFRTSRREWSRRSRAIFVSPADRLRKSRTPIAFSGQKRQPPPTLGRRVCRRSSRGSQLATVTDLRNRVWGSLPAELRWLLAHHRPDRAGDLLRVFAIGAANLLALAPPLTLKWLVDTIIPG